MKVLAVSNGIGITRVSCDSEYQNVTHSTLFFLFQPYGFLEQPIKYSSMEDVHALPQWDSSGDKHCVRIFVPEGSVLLQVRIPLDGGAFYRISY